MGTLRQDHEYLYRRVRLKAIVHSALGFVLLLLPSAVPQSTAGHVTQWVTQMMTYLGVIYLVLGLSIFYGLYKPHNTDYKALRFFLTLTAIYDTAWSLLLVAIILDKPNRGTAYVSVIYWYMTYNVWYVTRDPGWRAIQIVKGIREDARSDISLTQ